MLAMRAMDGAFGTDRPITVKTEIRELLLRVGLAHVEGLLRFADHYVVVRVGWV